MKLAALGNEYIDNANKISERIEQLKKKLENKHLSMTEKKNLRERIAILDDIRLEQRSIGHYLQTYHAT